MAQILTIEPDKKQLTLKKAQAFYDADELDKGFEAIQDFLAEHPNDAQGLTVAASILKKAEKTPIAYSLAKRAAELRPDRHETWLALGFCAHHLWQLDEAMSAYRKALQRADSNEAKALLMNNLCSLLIDQGKYKEAEKQARDSLDLADKPLTRHNLGLCLLGQRRWKEGWPYYSASVGTFNRQVWKYRENEPAWDGTKGQKVVVYGEQGIGDEISFCSMIPQVVKDARVVLDCDPRLQGLFRRSFPEAKVYGTRGKKQVVWDKEDREPDASISMGELGKFYRNDPEDFPGTPYLVPCPTRKAGWDAVFKSKGKPVIGIAWTGGNWLNGAVNRIIPLRDWAPIFKAVDAHWVSLQYKDTDSSELEGYPVTKYPWATLTKDYDDTAALVSALDMVVCVQTSVGHLAGALGVPAWVMVPKNSQWRYGSDFEDMPWYRSMRVFKAKGEWGPVVERVARELGAKFSR